MRLRWRFCPVSYTHLAVFSVSGEEEQRQFDQGENTDVMEFDPFIENEERLDNSQLEYGKVLNKYQSAGYQDYAGDPIVLSGI